MAFERYGTSTVTTRWWLRGRSRRSSGRYSSTWSTGGLTATTELTTHQDTFEYGMRAGVFSESTKDELVALWQNYRNGTYYQQERATAEQAEAMLRYAECLHDHILSLAGRDHDCIC
jgi:glutamate 5-kinase